jgi:hypothetical protein
MKLANLAELRSGVEDRTARVACNSYQDLRRIVENNIKICMAVGIISVLSATIV